MLAMLPRTSGKGLLLVVAAALATFAVVLHGSFVNWDDQWLIVTNPHIRGFHHLRTIVDPALHRVLLGAEYLPLRDINNVVDYGFFELDPRGYRLGNWLLYATAAGLAFAFLLEVLGSLRAALVGALLWAVHPMHAEVVAWASARKDLLNAVFALLAATLMMRAIRTGRHVFGAAALLSFVLASLSKTSAAALPVALAVWDFQAAGGDESLLRRVGRAALRAAPLLLVAAVGAWLNQKHQDQDWIRQEWRGGGWLPNAFIMSCVHLRYLTQIVLPFGLSPDYATDVNAPDKAWNMVGVLVLVVSVVLPFVLARRAPRVSAGILWWLVLLLPVANLVVPITNVSADRYVFLPSLGLCAIAGLAVDRMAASGERRARLVEGAVVAVIIAFAVLAALQARVWRSGLTLWSHAVAVQPGCGRAWQNLGDSLHLEGRSDEAMDAYRKMVEVEPWNAGYWMQAGNRLWEIGGPEHVEEVEEILRTAVLKARPDQGGALVALAWFVNQKGTPEGRQEAVDLLHEAVERQPTLAEAHFNLALWHEASGRTARAVESFEEALRLRMSLPDEVRIHDALLDIYTRTGDSESARRHRDERERKRALMRGE
jgi:hypothetical protein